MNSIIYIVYSFTEIIKSNKKTIKMKLISNSLMPNLQSFDNYEYDNSFINKILYNLCWTKVESRHEIFTLTHLQGRLVLQVRTI